MKKLKTIIKIIYNLLFVFLIISAAFILLTTYDIIPGFNFYVVMSGSMEPTIPVGSVVAVNEQDTYHVDDVITVRDRNNPNETFTHRVIRKIEEEEEEIQYETKGDANESADPEPSSEELVVGKQILSIPLIGYLVHFAKQPTGFILMIVVPSIIIATSEVTTIKEESGTLINKWKEKKEKDTEEEEKEEKPKKEKTKKPKKKKEPKKEVKKKQTKPKSKKKQKPKKKSSKRKNISSKKKKK